jgi:hypothetical protein
MWIALSLCTQFVFNSTNCLHGVGILKFIPTLSTTYAQFFTPKIEFPSF